MYKKLTMLGILSATVCLTACSTLVTTVIPGQNNYTVIATAEDSSTALQGAIAKATETCTNQKKNLVVLTQNTIYQGAGEQLGTVTQTVSNAVFLNGGPMLGSTKQPTDYKTTVTFVCQ